MAAQLLEVTGLAKRFGGFVALDGIDLAVTAGERVGLIGPNGSGKSTLVNCLCGTLVNEAGTVRFDGRDLAGRSAHQRTRLGMARSFQLPRPFASMTVADNLKVPLLYTVNARRKSALTEAEIAARCGELLTLVGLADRFGQYPRDLTQVDMRKLELARAMATEPKLLIADEAMAGLSNSEIDDILRLEPHQIVTLPVDLSHDPSRGRPDHAHHAFHQRGLAVAVSTQQRHCLAAADRQVDAAQNLLVTCSDVEVADN